MWALALIAALLWPSRLIGPIDGAPLDRPIEAILIGIVVPLLWFLHPQFLKLRSARVLVAALLLGKLAASILPVQTGWCATFLTAHDDHDGVFRLDRSWDVRTLWEPSPASCSAVMARPYEAFGDFPGWMINIPYGQDHEYHDGKDLTTLVATENPRPPDGRFAMDIEGFVHPSSNGTLSFDLGDDTTLKGAVDGGQAIREQRGGTVSVPLTAGSHLVQVQLDLQREGWRFVPRWDGRNVFAGVSTSIAPVGSIERLMARPAAWILAGVTWVMIAWWMIAAVRQLRPGGALLGWALLTTVFMGFVGALVQDAGVRFATLALFGALLVPVPEQLRNVRGAILLVGVGWLALFAGRSVHQIGQFSLYTVGDDWLTFQRFAYRIFFQRFWLEGGETTFWHQPFYRWTAGFLHLVFGDSSVGELYADVAGMMIGALCAFEIGRQIVGFRIGIAAGVLTLLTFTLGPNWYIIGRGLGDISAAMWLYLAVFALIAARAGSLRHAALAGAFSTLAFWTRLNHLPLVIAMAALALPADLSCSAVLRWRELWAQARRPAIIVYLLCLAGGACAFALRTWYYTGHFSMFYGTTRTHNGTGLGSTMGSFVSPAVWRSALESVLMVVTVQDPPRFDVRAIAVIAGVACAIAGLLGAPVARRLPLGATVFCIGAIMFGLVARGIAYPGRFSMQLIPIAIALSTATAAMASQFGTHRSPT
jgi:hypothetical protein